MGNSDRVVLLVGHGGKAEREQFRPPDLLDRGQVGCLPSPSLLEAACAGRGSQTWSPAVRSCGKDQLGSPMLGSLFVRWHGGRRAPPWTAPRGQQHRASDVEGQQRSPRSVCPWPLMGGRCCCWPARSSCFRAMVFGIY
nr:uncharacterized protein LOC127306959 [Lolium perenne]